MFCPNCGRNVNDTAKFCVGCGTPLGGAEQQNQTVLLSQEANIKPTSESSGDNRVTYTTENMFYNETSNANLKKSKKKSKKWPVFVVLGVLVIACGVFIAVLRGKGNTTAEKATNKAEEIKETLEQLEKADVGEYVTFGTYEQDNNLENGAEPIEWLVLERKDGKVLLLSRYALDTKPFHDQVDVEFTWEDCTLRKWLNDDFYCTAFSDDERSVIKESLLKNEGNSKYAIIGGNDTKDKVFILSFEEAITYFDADPDNEDLRRSAKVTEYAKEMGGFYYPNDDEYAGYGRYWLRSTQHLNHSLYYDVMGTIYNGSITQVGYVSIHESISVRPAIWVKY